MGYKKDDMIPAYIRKFPNEWDIKTKIEWLERAIIMYSIWYYDLGDSMVSDQQNDTESIQLYYMIKENPKEFEKTKYAYAFKDFDASTGFHLRSALTDKDREYIVHIANFIYAKAHGTLYKKYKRIKKKK
jgi:hypothetical protein